MTAMTTELMKTLLLDNPTCNYSCTYCGLRECHDSRRQSAGNVKIDWDTLEREMDLGSPGVRFSVWGGEPLANPLLWKVCEHLQEGGYRVQTVSMVTNGSLLYRYRDLIDRYDFLRFNISNDLLYQKSSRGHQYLEDPEPSAYVAQLMRSSRVSSIQTVVSGRSSHVLENLEYLRKFQVEHDVPVDSIDWFLMPVRDYSANDRGLLLSLEDREFVQQLTEFCCLALLDEGKTQVYRSFYRRLEDELTSMTTPPPSEYRARCESFRTGQPMFVSTSGEHYYCTENFDRGIRENNINPPGRECLECRYWNSCNGMCANLSTEMRRFSCPSMKAWHGVIQDVLYRGMTEEQRREFDGLFRSSDR